MEWISVNDRMPEPGTMVLVCLDYRPWNKKRKILQAAVHFSPVPRPYGGPYALTGTGTVQGVFFAVPAVLNPEVVTHWMPEPELPVDN